MRNLAMSTFGRIASTAAIAATMIGGGLAPSWAGALPANPDLVNAVNSGNSDSRVIKARWIRHRFFPGAVVGGIAAGIVGSAIASSAYPYYEPYPYGYGYAYDPYDGPYYPGPYWRYHRWHHW
jgi:hypothetical protein